METECKGGGHSHSSDVFIVQDWLHMILCL